MATHRAGGIRWTGPGPGTPPRQSRRDLCRRLHGWNLQLDDILFLEELTEEILAEDAHLFPLRDSEQYYRNNRDLSNKAARFAGPNPEYGALITYYLKEPPTPMDPSPEGAPSEEEAPNEPPEVSFQILDSSGTVIRELTGPDRQGFNRIAWDLRMTADTTDSSGEGSRRRPTMTDVDPGRYTVRMTVRGIEMVQTVAVIADRRRRPN
ncbi:hypothetical protein ACFL0I_01345 [Gemmatimonadota bacterium]